jgi:hypothetical protein
VSRKDRINIFNYNLNYKFIFLNTKGCKYQPSRNIPTIFPGRGETPHVYYAVNPVHSQFVREVTANPKPCYTPDPSHFTVLINATYLGRRWKAAALFTGVAMSLGTDRVRTTFNPSSNRIVDKIKWKTSELIDLCNTASCEAGAYSTMKEELRLWALAMTAYEEAAMWATKAATIEAKPAKPDYPADHPAPGDLGSVPT